MRPETTKSIFSQSRVPVLQNRVFTNAEEARAARAGVLEIAYCPERKMAFNTRFDPQLISYDKDYNNDVPSLVFLQYLDQIAEYLIERYRLNAVDAHVLDLGCGDGKLMDILCERVDSLRCTGVDPAYSGDASKHDGRFTVHREYFSEDLLPSNVTLVVCRHTLEHLATPEAFLEPLGAALPEGTPFFFEVPRLEWTLEHGAFWDFCYEHCNYFTDAGMRQMLGRSGLPVERLTPSFEDQYWWCEGTRVLNSGCGLNVADQLDHDLLAKPRESFEQTLGRIRDLGDLGTVAVWGMATKGIMLSLALDEAGIDAGVFIDGNEAKQGHFTPVNAKRIDSPRRHASRELMIVCMNPNYLVEISEQARELGMSGRIYTPEIEAFIALGR